MEYEEKLTFIDNLAYGNENDYENFIIECI